jgi:translation initiation factor 3 subunit A
MQDVENLNTDSLMRLQVEQLEKEKRERESRLRIIAKRIDHVERAYRQEERPLLAKDYELQQASDRATFEQIQKGRVDTARLAHKRDLETKKRLSRILPEFEARKAIILENRSAEYERKQTEAQAKIGEEKTKRRTAVLKVREEDRLRQEKDRLYQEAAESARREAEELERKKREGALYLTRWSIFFTGPFFFFTEEELELAAKEAAKEAAKLEEEARAARMREERERQRAADLERIKQQQEREEEAARRAQERRRPQPAAAPQDGGWRRAGVPSAPTPPPVRTPPRSESPAPSGPPRLFGRGGAASGWRAREQAKAAGATGGPAPSSVAPEEPKKAENKDDGFQTVKNVWKPSRLRGQQ